MPHAQPGLAPAASPRAETLGGRGEPSAPTLRTRRQHAELRLLACRLSATEQIAASTSRTQDRWKYFCLTVMPAPILGIIVPGSIAFRVSARMTLEPAATRAPTFMWRISTFESKQTHLCQYLQSPVPSLFSYLTSQAIIVAAVAAAQVEVQCFPMRALRVAVHDWCPCGII